MKKILLFLAAAAASAGLWGQELPALMQQIEKNNTTLQALRGQTDADKLSLHVGLTPDDPTVEWGYLWGTPAASGNRVDLSCTQVFDFPTVYYYRKKMADGAADAAELSYAVQRNALMLQVRQTCMELTYHNAMQAELARRLEEATRMALSYQKKFDEGACGILERNKADLNLLSARKALGENELERDRLLAELARYNGGQAVVFALARYEEVLLPADFDAWYQRVESKNMELQSLRAQQELAQQQVALSQAGRLPQLSLGYSSEKILDTKLQGLTVGLSIPLWKNKNAVKASRAQAAALQSLEADARLQFRAALQATYAKAQGQQRLLSDYRATLRQADATALLQEALDKGHITLMNYLVELSAYYEHIDQLLAAERDFQLTLSELLRWSE